MPNANILFFGRNASLYRYTLLLVQQYFPGYKLRFCPEPLTYMHQLQALTPKLVLVDGYNATDVMDNLRQVQYKINLPKTALVSILPVYANEEQQKQMEILGFHGFLYKPFETEDFFHTIRQCLNQPLKKPFFVAGAEGWKDFVKDVGPEEEFFTQLMKEQSDSEGLPAQPDLPAAVLKLGVAAGIKPPAPATQPASTGIAKGSQLLFDITQIQESITQIQAKTSSSPIQNKPVESPTQPITGSAIFAQAFSQLKVQEETIFQHVQQPLDPTPESTPESTPELTPKPATESTPKPATESTPESILELTPKPTPALEKTASQQHKASETASPEGANPYTDAGVDLQKMFKQQMHSQLELDSAGADTDIGAGADTGAGTDNILPTKTPEHDLNPSNAGLDNEAIARAVFGMEDFKEQTADSNPAESHTSGEANPLQIDWTKLQAALRGVIEETVQSALSKPAAGVEPESSQPAAALMNNDDEQ